MRWTLESQGIDEGSAKTPQISKETPAMAEASHSSESGDAARFKTLNNFSRGDLPARTPEDLAKYCAFKT
jgi:hypothetical protein